MKAATKHEEGAGLATTPCSVPLAKKHAGMRVSATGLLATLAGDRGDVTQGDQFLARELSRHLEELARRFYAGDMTVTDEFLQLYALDDSRPN